MSRTILLYGATGFTGRLIAEEARRLRESGAPDWNACRMVLGARDGRNLEALASDCAMDFRVFGLDERAEVTRGLRGVDVLINAAGPFAWTADRLAKVALEVNCHYVDINGEIDVYRKLDDLGRFAAQRRVAMVSGAGFAAAASNVLLDHALDQIKNTMSGNARVELGEIRIAVSRMNAITRGSAQTVARSMREQVTVVRSRVVRKAGGTDVRKELFTWHEPVGKLERMFDFGDRKSREESRRRKLRIASLANLVDTLTAQRTVLGKEMSANSIESYLETGALSRIAYQLGALAAPIALIPGVQGLLKSQAGMLPVGPDRNEIKRDRRVIVLEISDANRTPLLEWWLETPNSYQFTAQVVVAVAQSLLNAPTTAKTGAGDDAKVGWLTPARALSGRAGEFLDSAGPFRGCRLDRRLG